MWDSLLSAAAVLLLAETLSSAQGIQYCQDTSDCIMFVGYTCQKSQCVCEPDRTMGLFSCAQVKSYGDKCRSDQDCYPGDVNLICARWDSRTCKCRRGLVWDIVSKRCYNIEDDNSYMTSKFDPVRDIIIPAVILTTLGATGWLCFRLFCNCGKTWRRRRRGGDLGRSIEEGAVAAQPTTWVASYRVFSGVDARAMPPCLLLPVGPPPYEEALKHKVILSSYRPQLPPQAQL